MIDDGFLLNDNGNMIYTLYTDKEKEIIAIQLRIRNLKELLQQTDYKTLKYFEGYYTSEEYEPIRQERQNYRNEINQLEEELKTLSEGD